jgi:predicted ATPase
MAKASSKAPKKPAAETPAPPYYLQKARVKDYPPIRDAEVEFKPGLNIIIGTNGAGKTRFLRSVADGIALKERNAASIGTTFRIGGATIIKVLYTKRSSKLKNYPLALGEMFAPFNIKVTADGVQTQVDALVEAWNHITVLREGEHLLGYDVIELNHELPKPQELALLAEAPNFYFNPRQMPDNDLPHQLFPIIWGARSAFFRQSKQGAEALTPLTKIFRLVINLYLEHLNEYLARYTPIQTARLSNQFKIQFNEANDNFTVNGLHLEYDLNGNWHLFSDLSDGIQRLVYLVTQVTAPMYYQAKSKSASTFHVIERSRIILLEEPERDIHPHQLHLLLKLIRKVSEKHQVILTTYSPQVLDMLKADELDCILICELKDPQKGTKFRRLTADQQEQARRYMREVGFLSDYWRLEDLDGVIANATQ